MSGSGFSFLAGRKDGHRPFGSPKPGRSDLQRLHALRDHPVHAYRIVRTRSDRAAEPRRSLSVTPAGPAGWLRTIRRLGAVALPTRLSPLTPRLPLRRGPLPGVYLGAILDATRVNAAVTAAFEARQDEPDTRRTHLFHGRYENIYIDRRKIPEIAPVLTVAAAYARELLGRDELRLGFWFNRMGPGERTGLHTHVDENELLSGVYYVDVPQDSGRLLLYAGNRRRPVEALPGRYVLFEPDLPHEVEPNTSGRVRLSVAFNFGPAEQNVDPSER